MGAYLIADVHITDPATYEEYKRQVSPLIAWMELRGSRDLALPLGLSFRR